MRPGTQNRAVIYSLGRLREREIATVTVSGIPASFEQKEGALLINFPAGIDSGMPACIRIGLA